MVLIRPDTPEWEELRVQIEVTNDQAVTYTNAARDAQLAQGELFGKIETSAVALMATQTGISKKTALTRRSVAAAVAPGTPLRILLEENNDISVSFDTLKSLLVDEDPQALLTKLFAEAKAGGVDRVTRDAARRARGLLPGTVGTVDATISRMMADPVYAAQMAEELSQTAAGRMLLDRMVTEARDKRRRTEGREPLRIERDDDITSAIYSDGLTTTRLAESLQRLVPLSEKFRDELLAHINEQRRRYELLESQVRGGSFDVELHLLLGGGEG